MTNQISLVSIGLKSFWGYGYAMAFKQISPGNGAIFGVAPYIINHLANRILKSLNLGDTSTALLSRAVAWLSSYYLLTQILLEPLTPAGAIKIYLGMEGTKLLVMFYSVLTIAHKAYDIFSALMGVQIDLNIVCDNKNRSPYVHKALGWITNSVSNG